MKVWHFTKFLSAFLTLLASSIAFSDPLLADTPAVENPDVDVPLCYMQTPDGRTVNLVNMCGQETIPNTTKGCAAGANAAKVSIANYSYDGNFLTGKVLNQTCQNVKYIKVNYEVLDESGSIIDNGFIYAQPVNVGPGQSASFRGAVVSGAKVQATHLDWSE
ncbi:MAG TPA: FxLYD domain-containing protein [Kamptonema sp.]|nr:FxLYD domain-containing protein [Kamptonema sp.]